MWNRRFAIALFLILGLTVALAAQPPGKPADSGLAKIPTDVFFFASVKVSRLWDNPAAKPLRDWVEVQKGGTSERLIGLTPAELDRITLFAATANPKEGGAPLMLINTRRPYSAAKVLAALGGEELPRGTRAAPDRAFAIDSAFRRLVFLDDRTLLFLPRPLDDRSVGPDLLARLKDRKPDGPLAGALAADHDLVIGLNVGGLGAVADESKWESDKRLTPYLGLLKAKTATLTADFDKTAKVRFTLAFGDADAAKRAAPVLEDGIKALAGHMSRKPDRFSEQFDPAEQRMIEWMAGAMKGAKVTVDGANLIATADAPFTTDLTKFVAVLPKQLLARRDERHALNNLKQLALAIHNYDSAYARCPSDAMTAADNKLLAWSWRVQILPFIEQANLYKQLDFTKPWDDPANLKTLEAMEMPKTFEFPGRAAPKGHTYFRIFTIPKGTKGMDRPWLKEGERGPRLSDIADGTSNTFMIVEAEEAVPWYKLDVLAYDGKLPLPPLGDPNTGQFLAAFGDGTVRSFRPNVLGEETIRAMITIQGGEVFDLSK